jgi:hypothetical protein
MMEDDENAAGQPRDLLCLFMFLIHGIATRFVWLDV